MLYTTRNTKGCMKPQIIYPWIPKLVCIIFLIGIGMWSVWNMKNIRLIYSFVALLIIFISYAYSLTKADLLDLGPETKRISMKGFGYIQWNALRSLHGKLRYTGDPLIKAVGYTAQALNQSAIVSIHGDKLLLHCDERFLGTSFYLHFRDILVVNPTNKKYGFHKITIEITTEDKKQYWFSFNTKQERDEFIHFLKKNI